MLVRRHDVWIATEPGATPLRMSFPGSNVDTTLAGVARLPGTAHYLRGNDPAG
ncbi:MAG TPA: hypothetical protein VE010_07400 [Thermoanaerobaculia bacterium]|nr:hypothetical protein [Thermoanaerobaculia bacterium]